MQYTEDVPKLRDFYKNAFGSRLKVQLGLASVNNKLKLDLSSSKLLLLSTFHFLTYVIDMSTPISHHILQPQLEFAQGDL